MFTKTLKCVNLSRSVIIPARRWFNQTGSGESFDRSRGRTKKLPTCEFKKNIYIYIYMQTVLIFNLFTYVQFYNIIYQYAKILDIEHLWSEITCFPLPNVFMSTPSLRLVRWRHASMDSDALANGASERPRHWASWQRPWRLEKPMGKAMAFFGGGGKHVGKIALK